MFSKQSRRHERIIEGENPYWVSFSDIMAGLLVIFILSVVYLVLQLYEVITLNRETQERVREALSLLSQIEAIREEMLEEVRSELAAVDINVEIVEDSTVLRVPEDQLYFDQGQYSIREDLEYVVEQVGEKVYQAIIREDRLQFIDTVFVEGHTDSIPMNREMGNWGLSSYRAISVWNYWTQSPGNRSALLALRNRDGEPVFSVSGYADTRRVEDNEITEDDRRRNRRIDIRFTMRSPDSLDLGQILEQLENATSNP